MLGVYFEDPLIKICFGVLGSLIVDDGPMFHWLLYLILVYYWTHDFADGVHAFTLHRLFPLDI